MHPAHRLRSAANWMNLSTPAGFLLSMLGGAPPRRIGHGLWLGRGYGLALPPAPAFTMGNVVLVRAPTEPGRDPLADISRPVLGHEERHSTQYAIAGGILMPVAYVIACAWSWLRTGDYASRNIFERHAGLTDGGYVERPTRGFRGRRAPAGAGRS